MTTLDLSQTQVAKLYVSNCPNLAYINIKNSRLIEGNILGRQDNTALPGPPPLPPLAISNNPNLTFICCDPDEVFMVMNHGNFYSPIDANISVSSYCTFAPGGGYNTIMGSVTLDCGGANVPMSLQRITIDDGLQNGIAFTNGIGNYVVYAASGTQTVTLQSVNPAYFTATPANYTFNFSGTGTAETADFCLQPNGVRPDLEVTILPLTAARPGFGALYKIVYHNQGNQVQSGSVVLTFDDVVLDVNLVVPTATTSTANTITWDFSNLNPFENREITINFQINSPTDTPPVNIGDVLHYTVALNTAETDETPADNQMTFNQTTVGSFDPNDKAVVEGAAISTSQIDDYLHYVVRFQNTGTAAAENIVVKDLLETNLDWSTLQMVSSSHSYRSTLTAGNRLEVFYESINLPPSSTDEQGSHGYIAFKIKPKSTVVENDVIQNTANIYFDFNFPIVTNTVATTVSNLGTPNFNQKKLFTVYPNPTNNILNISLSDNDTITAVTICNTLGQKVMNDNVKTLDVSSLTAGTYLITVATDKGKATQKIIKL
jgi:uncharacterized repeat protein (TIGR01451 family)